jgi:DNA-binding NarL/FixJ family response regulator
VYVDAAIIAKNFEEPARKASNGGDPKMLTDRETDVLKATALGFTNKEIARKLDVSVKSIETYKSRAAEKLGLKSRAEIVRYAAAHGWLENLT